MTDTDTFIFLGTPDFAATVLATLIDSPYRPKLVITEPDKPVGRKRVLTSPPVKLLAERAGIEVAQPKNQDELRNAVQAARPSLGIVAAYGRILRPDVLTLPTHGFLNVHASLLPKYRGASPIQAALLAGESETGVTIMEIDAGLDTGPMLSWAPVSIEPDDTTTTLSERLAQTGSALLLETIPLFLRGTIAPQPQREEIATTTRLLTKESGRLTGNEPPIYILRMLQAYTPWPGVWFELDDQRVLLLSAHIEEDVLVPEQLQLAGKNPISWAEICRDRPELAEQVRNFLPM